MNRAAAAGQVTWSIAIPWPLGLGRKAAERWRLYDGVTFKTK
jgi:hypothetical protein